MNLNFFKVRMSVHQIFLKKYNNIHVKNSMPYASYPYFQPFNTGVVVVVAVVVKEDKKMFDILEANLVSHLA